MKLFRMVIGCMGICLFTHTSFAAVTFNKALPVAPKPVVAQPDHVPILSTKRFTKLYVSPLSLQFSNQHEPRLGWETSLGYRMGSFSALKVNVMKPYDIGRCVGTASWGLTF